MIKQDPISKHKIIFTITCEGNDLMEAMAKAIDVSAAIKDYHLENTDNSGKPLRKIECTHVLSPPQEKEVSIPYTGTSSSPTDAAIQ